MAMRSSGLYIRRSDYEKTDIYLADFICAYFFIAALNLAVKMIWGNFSAWGYISKGVLAILLFRVFFSTTKQKFLISIASEATIAVLFLFTYLRGTGTQGLSSIAFNSLFVYVPLGLCLLHMDSVQVLLDRLYRITWPTHIVLLYVAFSFQNQTDDAYSMSVGYALLLQLFVIFDHYFEEKKRIDLVFVVIDLIVIILYSSRGPIVCIVAYLFIKIFISGEIPRYKRIMIALLLVIVVFSYNYMYAFFVRQFVAVWSGSRTLSLFFSGNLLHDSGRSAITTAYLEMIKQKPLLGYGLAGGWFYSTYPHNIILEMMLSFGIPIGIIIFLLVLFGGVQSVHQSQSNERRLSIILFAMVLELFLSGSFITSTTFFMMIAMIIRSKRISRLKQVNKH